MWWIIIPVGLLFVTNGTVPVTEKEAGSWHLPLWNEFIATSVQKGKGHILLEVHKQKGSDAAWNFPQEVSAKLFREGKWEKNARLPPRQSKTTVPAASHWTAAFHDRVFSSPPRGQNGLNILSLWGNGWGGWGKEQMSSYCHVYYE